MLTLGDRVKRGLRIFTALVVVTMLVLLTFTASKETFSSLIRMNLLYILLALGLWFIYLVLDAFRISLITHGVTGKWGNIRTDLDILLTGAFLAAVTPFQTGGLPVQLYILNKDDIPWGKGTLIILLRGIFFALMVATLAPFLIPIIMPILTKGSNTMSIKIITRYSLIAYSILLGILVFVLYKPNIIKRFLYRLTTRKGKTTRTTRWIYRIFKEIGEMKEGFWRFTMEKKWHSLASYVLTFIAYIPYFFIASFLLRGLGINTSFIKTAFLQLVVVFFTFFSPTPGATGVSEGGFALLFSPIVQKHLLGIFTILWRFFTFYLTAIIGGIMTLKILKLGEMTFEKNKVQ